jgi:hypothetical protein
VDYVWNHLLGAGWVSECMQNSKGHTQTL